MGIFGTIMIMGIIVNIGMLFLLKILGTNKKSDGTVEDKISEDTDSFNRF